MLALPQERPARGVRVGSIVIRCSRFDEMRVFWQAALGYVLGGKVGSSLGWRWAFYLVVPPGVLLGLQPTAGEGASASQLGTSKRKDGSLIRFDKSAAVIVNKQNEPVGTRISGARGARGGSR